MVTVKDWFAAAFAREGGPSRPEKQYYRTLYSVSNFPTWALWSMRVLMLIGALAALILFGDLLCYSARPNMFPISKTLYAALAILSGGGFFLVYASLGVSWYRRFGMFLTRQHKRATLIKCFGSESAAIVWAKKQKPSDDISPLLFLQQDMAWLSLFKSLLPWAITLFIAVLFGSACDHSQRPFVAGLLGIAGLLALFPATIPAFSQMLPWDGSSDKTLRFQRQVALSDIRDVLGTQAC